MHVSVCVCVCVYVCVCVTVCACYAQVVYFGAKEAPPAHIGDALKRLEDVQLIDGNTVAKQDLRPLTKAMNQVRMLAHRCTQRGEATCLSTRRHLRLVASCDC